MKEKKFKNDRFITRGVAESLKPLLVMILWEMIDSMEIVQDYLQVFNLSEDKGKQKIEHIQEEPEYRREYLLKVEIPVFTSEVFVIDDETHSAMLLASECRKAVIVHTRYTTQGNTQKKRNIVFLILSLQNMNSCYFVNLQGNKEMI